MSSTCELLLKKITAFKHQLKPPAKVALNLTRPGVFAGHLLFIGLIAFFSASSALFSAAYDLLVCSFFGLLGPKSGLHAVDNANARLLKRAAELRAARGKLFAQPSCCDRHRDLHAALRSSDPPVGAAERLVANLQPIWLAPTLQNSIAFAALHSTPSPLRAQLAPNSTLDVSR